jgi:hypothetical protein
MYNKISIEKITVKIFLVLGITIPLAQFLYNRSLWLDEAMLALNIIHKGYFELLKPLDYAQVAPILFLGIEKLISTIIPNSEYGLRLFPLLCYWASLFFFYKTVKILFDNRFATILALALFVSNVTLIFYSSEVKQYMCDVLAYTAIVYFILKKYKKKQAKLYILGIAGTLAIFLSNVAPVILSVAGLYILYEQFYTKRQKSNIRGSIVVFIIWLSVFAVYYYFFIFNHPVRDFMVRYWLNTYGFLPLHSLSGFVEFLFVKTGVILKTFSTRIPLLTIIVIFFITGIYSIVREKKIGLAILACFPVIIHFLLSGLHLYPFNTRLVLYIIPGLMLICIAGFKYLITLFSPRLKPVIVKSFCFIPVIFLFSFYEFPINFLGSFGVKENIKYLKENVNDNEIIYVFWFGGPSWQYYQDIGFADFKIPVIIGKEKFIGEKKHHLIIVNKPDYLTELKKIHGKCWLYFQHGKWFLEDEKYIINYLNSVGHNKIKEYKATHSSIYLYDFR